MSFVTTPDGAEIYYKDWGWPVNADAWDGQMLFLAQRGYRCVALDRRGHGRSSQPSARNDMDGTERVKKAILVAAVPPLMLRTPANPEGLPMAMFDAIRAGVAGDRSQYYQDLAIAFYGANRAGARVSQGILDQLRTIRSCRSRVRPGSRPG